MAAYRFGSGPDFAEVAEALKVPTENVLSFKQMDEGIIALYSPDASVEDPEVYACALVRDDDGILQHSPPKWRGNWSDIKQQIKRGGAA